MRIGFLFNHDQIHQVAHSLPVALALAAAQPDWQVVIATTNPRIAAEVERQIGKNHPTNLTSQSLGLQSALSKFAVAALGRLLPLRKVLLLRDNLAFFRDLDAMVVTERTSLLLKTRFGLTGTKFILTDHGAGDRAIGFGKTTALFDLILAAGPKIRDRLIAEAGVDQARLTITGYPKFDVAGHETPRLPLQANGNPTVLYNPHVSPHLSSWYRQGRQVLDFFLANPHYNLILAPHIMMFQRRVNFTVDQFSFGLPGVIEPQYHAAANIHIDLGSLASTDMTYTNAADIYLGDVSSQIYEFIKQPRPCVFLNTHGVAHAGDANYAHWQAGPVITDCDDLGAALQKAQQDQKSVYAPIQQKLFDYSFDLTEEPSSTRAARAIVTMLSANAAKIQEL